MREKNWYELVWGVDRSVLTPIWKISFDGAFSCQSGFYLQLFLMLGSYSCGHQEIDQTLSSMACFEIIALNLFCHDKCENLRNTNNSGSYCTNNNGTPWYLIYIPVFILLTANLETFSGRRWQSIKLIKNNKKLIFHELRIYVQLMGTNSLRESLINLN